MPISLPISNMTTKEKLEAMELLWDDLCQQSNDVPSPHWHKLLLLEREKTVALGGSTFFDLDEAKKQIEAMIK